MHAMAEFMGQCHHVARLALIIHQHVRMRRRRGGVRECARRFTGAHWRIDPAVGEEAFRDGCHLWREIAVGLQNRDLRIAPADLTFRRERQRRVAVPVRQRLLFEPARLHLVVAMRQPRIGRAHRGDQRIDDFALNTVRKMTRVRDVLKAAPAVGNFLVLGERVGDERKGAFIGPEGFRQRPCCGFALFRRAILQQRQCRLDGQLLTADFEAERRDGLVELPVPRRIAADGFFVEQLLDTVLELVWLVLAQILDPRPVIIQRRNRHCALDHTVIDAIEFEREEQQMCRCSRDPLGHVAVEFRDCRVDSVSGMGETCERRQPSRQIVDRLIALDRVGQPFAAIGHRDLLGDLALVGRLECRAVGVQLVEIADDLGRIDRRIEVSEIPLG